MSNLESIQRKNAESVDKKMEKSKFKPLFDRVDELKVECTKIDFKQQQENFVVKQLEEQRTKMVDDLVADKKNVEKIQP